MLTTKRMHGAGALAALGLAVVVAALAWQPWEPSPERLAAQLDAEISAIEQTLRSDRAALLREAAGCQGDGVEFGAALGKACRAQLDTQARLLASGTRSIEAHLDRLREQRRSLP